MLVKCPSKGFDFIFCWNFLSCYAFSLHGTVNTFRITGKCSIHSFSFVIFFFLIFQFFAFCLQFLFRDIKFWLQIKQYGVSKLFYTILLVAIFDVSNMYSFVSTLLLPIVLRRYVIDSSNCVNHRGNLVLFFVGFSSLNWFISGRQVVDAEYKQTFISQ